MPSPGYGANRSTFQFQGLVETGSTVGATSARLATAVQVLACALFPPIESMARDLMHLGMEAETERLALVALRTLEGKERYEGQRTDLKATVVH